MVSYQVQISDRAQKEIRSLSGNMRQRVIQTLRKLETQPRPANSIALDTTNLPTHLSSTQEARRIRLENWRIVYLVDDDESLVTVLTVRKRPPYQYEDLGSLLSNL